MASVPLFTAEVSTPLSPTTLPQRAFLLAPRLPLLHSSSSRICDHLLYCLGSASPRPESQASTRRWLLIGEGGRGRGRRVRLPPADDHEDVPAALLGRSGSRVGGMRELGAADLDVGGSPAAMELRFVHPNTMEPGRVVRVLPGCSRAFHQDCVDRWLAISPRCPVCNVWAAPLQCS